jgi:membrane protein YqaA with SNARE-associated domain
MKHLSEIAQARYSLGGRSGRISCNLHHRIYGQEHLTCVSNFFRPLVTFLLHLGYFGPVLMGVLDSSFLVLPFGNDLLVVVLVSRHHQGLALYVLAAACGSTVGAAILAWIAGRVGQEGIRKLAGEKRFKKLESKIQKGGGLAVFLATLAPPPFPYTMVVASAAALQYSKVRLLTFNFVGRAIRFTILGVLALVFGRTVIQVTQSPAFRWSMLVFIALCLLGSGFSIWHWISHTRGGKN